MPALRHWKNIGKWLLIYPNGQPKSFRKRRRSLIEAREIFRFSLPYAERITGLSSCLYWLTRLT
jgi:hypothetical protein